jgi:hypothetical protein
MRIALRAVETLTPARAAIFIFGLRRFLSRRQALAPERRDHHPEQ